MKTSGLGLSVGRDHGSMVDSKWHERLSLRYQEATDS